MISMDTKTFATAINCMDGRVQIPVIEFLRKKYGVDFVDVVTEAGPVAIIAEHRDMATIESIKKRVDVSKMRHGSKHLALVAHHDCTANPVRPEQQIAQLRAALEQMKWWGYWDVKIGLWVDESWQVHEVK